jgi:phosphoenolpyruvate carboxykinase (GTP)
VRGFTWAHPWALRPRPLQLARSGWRAEILGHEELFIDVHDHLPPEMIYQRELSICRL